MLSILVVDDQPHIQRVIKLGLSKKGYRVDTAGDGCEALERMQNAHYDVLVTDMDMPKMTGKELCERVESDFENPPDKIFLVTAQTDSQLRRWSEIQQRVDFLEKPLSLRVLGERLDSVEKGEGA